MAGKLAYILNDMLTQAKVHGSCVRHLRSGLAIQIIVDGQQVRVTLKREGVTPSLQEWDTVMRCYPYPTPKIMPAPDQRGNNYYLTGVVPSEIIMQGRL